MISCLQKQLKTRLPSNIRQTACECIYSVTYGKSMNIHSMAVALYNPALIWCMEFPVVMFSRHPSVTQCASWSNITRVCNMRLSYQSWLICYLLLNLAVLPPEFDSFKIAFPVGVFYLLRGVLCDFDYWNTSLDMTCEHIQKLAVIDYGNWLIDWWRFFFLLSADWFIALPSYCYWCTSIHDSCFRCFCLQLHFGDTFLREKLPHQHASFINCLILCCMTVYTKVCFC